MALIQAYGESIHEHILYGKKTMLGTHTQTHRHTHTNTRHKKKNPTNSYNWYSYKCSHAEKQTHITCRARPNPKTNLENNATAPNNNFRTSI